MTKTGLGVGTVTSDTGGIACKPTCSASYPAGTVVTLTATPSSGSSFTGFIGCTPATATTCAVVMSAARSVSAAFTSP